MKVLIYTVGVAVLVLSGCSKEDREEVANRVGTAAKALTGDLNSNPVEPSIVKEVKIKEAIRQNREWTPENQAAHPLEYCLAQQEETLKLSKSVEVQSHRLRIARNALLREMQSDDISLSTCRKSLEDLKRQYREAEVSNCWPIVFNGYSLARDKVRALVVDLNRKVKAFEAARPEKKNQIAKVEMKIALLDKEVKRIADLRERLQSTITDIRTSRICEGEKEIGDVLNSINDSIKALDHEACGITAEDICTESGTANDEEEFDLIMAK